MSTVAAAVATGSRPPMGTGRGRARGAGLRLRKATRAVPRAALICALVALANGLAWSLIVPPFQVPDENAHYAYVQQIAERGTVPRLTLHEGLLSPAEDAILGAVNFYRSVGEGNDPVPLSTIEQNGVEAAEDAPLSTRGNGNALSATNNPPLYYVLEAIPYKLASSGSVLDRLAAMRVLSALMGAFTIFVIYLFLAELLPGKPWACVTGALVAAFQPLFGFMSGGVNNDDLLYLMAAGVLYALSKIFRRGLTPGTGALLGACLGAGLITKLSLLGFVPAAAAGVALGLWRGWPAERARSIRGALWAAALGALPLLGYLVLNRLVWHRGAIPGGVGAVAALPGTAIRFNFREELSHIWQLFLPPVGMRHQFTYLPLWKTWFKGFFGRLGWLDYKFPYHFYLGVAVVSIVFVVLAVIEMVRRRWSFRRRMGEFAVYALAVAGICVEIGVESYREMVQTGGLGQFEQARYLLPLLALYAAIAALAARAGDRRWGPAIGALLLVCAIGHDIAAQMITVARYYT